MYTTTQAAAHLGCSARTVRRWAARLGVGKYIGPICSLSVSDVEQLRRHIRPGKAGNPGFGAELGRRGGIASGEAKRAKRK